MPRPLAFAFAPILFALVAGCSETPAANAPNSAAQTCPDGYFWNGKECEKQRTIILDQAKQDPPPPPPPPPPAK